MQNIFPYYCNIVYDATSVWKNSLNLQQLLVMTDMNSVDLISALFVQKN